MPIRNEEQSEKAAIQLFINGKAISVPAGTSVAAALMQSGISARVSVAGEPRAPLCAMGICMECCATVNSIPHVRTCQLTAEDGMQVSTI